jgi:uncharacterized membrane protein
MRQPFPVCYPRSTRDLSELQERLDQVRREAREEEVVAVLALAVQVRPQQQSGSRLRHLGAALLLRLRLRRLPRLLAR